MIRVFRVGTMVQTLLGEDDFIRALQRHLAIEIVQEPWRADVFVARKLKRLAPWRALFPQRRFVVWTNEPRWDTTPEAHVRSRWRGDVRVMNLYTGDAFWHNRHFLGSYHYDYRWQPATLTPEPLQAMTVAAFEARRDMAIAVLTCRARERTRLMWRGENVDLEQVRASVALHGHRHGWCEVAGRQWPAGVAIEETRTAGDWATQKVALLSGYRYAFCLENTRVPYYCTEKLWHGIVAGTLPIYYARGTSIHETFPRDSFVDLSAFEDPNEVYGYIRGLGVQGCVDRINRCIEVYNHEREGRAAEIARDTERFLQGFASALRGD